MVRRAIPIALTTLLVGSAQIHAQRAYTEFNVHGATLVNDLFDESSNALQLGFRLVHRTHGGFSFGGNFDWASAGDVLVRQDLAAVSATILLYSFEVDYAARVSPRTDFFVGSGIGAATVRFDTAGNDRLTDSSTGQLVPVAAGLKFLNRADDPSWAFRVEARDNVILRTIIDPATLGEEDEVRHNWELSAGLSFLFGGPSKPRVATPVPRTERQRPVAEEPPAAREAEDEGPGPGIAEPEPELEPEPVDPGAEPVHPGPQDTPAEAAADIAAPETPDVGACATVRPWFNRGDAIAFDGRFYVPIGDQEPITLDNLTEVGEHDGVRIYVATFAEEPYADLWLPSCTGGYFHLYVEAGAE